MSRADLPAVMPTPPLPMRVDASLQAVLFHEEENCPASHRPDFKKSEISRQRPEELRASLEQLLQDGRMRPHEPAFDPNPADYVSWEYCKGFADGANATENAGR